MGEPAVGCGAVPVLYLGRDVDHVARMQLPGLLAPLLIPAPPCHTDEDLSAALAGMVNVPVVAAARLEGYSALPSSPSSSAQTSLAIRKAAQALGHPA